MTREVAGKSGTRILKLSEKVHTPKAITSYKDAEAQLKDWENVMEEYVKLAGQDLAPLKHGPLGLRPGLPVRPRADPAEEGLEGRQGQG